MNGRLILEDGSVFKGISFGSEENVAGEVVFATGMTGYEESLTDPSYKGQILIFTYPLIGNYGVPSKEYWESDRIQTTGIIVSTYNPTPSHFKSQQTLSDWLKKEKIPGLEIKDTRVLTQKIRTKGTMLGKIIFKKNIKLYDPNRENLLTYVSIQKIVKKGSGKKTILLIDCGAKGSIARCLIKRGVRVIIVPWDFDPFNSKLHLPGEQSRHLEGVRQLDGIVISNGPGDPKMAEKTIQTIKIALGKKIPTLGICLGHQLLSLAAGGDTRKLKFGHRSQNQPCILVGSPRCFITTQNHSFEVFKIPPGFKTWFVNANDGSNEGIIHKKLPFMSVQFHPEANPGPQDTEWVFDAFLKRI
ncbi:MAG: glutamine-hydrolyzing carbamoyl-phosphate synthase small subunit [Candidatus Levybacteria bacterium]|nr:glutamine-hydrolyzing carbamoyl-phosphate synthase small subunit [Candidatus Levybacteria bacterium]